METLDEQPTTQAVSDPELIAHLRQVNSDLQHEVEVAKQRHIEEVAYISECLKEAANDHDLCSVYDDVIETINSSSKVTVPLGMRDVDVVVRVRGTASFHFDRQIEVAIPIGARADSEVAQERALDVLRSLGIRNLALNGSDLTIVSSEPADPF